MTFIGISITFCGRGIFATTLTVPLTSRRSLNRYTDTLLVVPFYTKTFSLPQSQLLAYQFRGFRGSGNRNKSRPSPYVCILHCNTSYQGGHEDLCLRMCNEILHHWDNLPVHHIRLKQKSKRITLGNKQHTKSRKSETRID